jgi:hypothetical protein
MEQANGDEDRERYGFGLHRLKTGKLALGGNQALSQR